MYVVNITVSGTADTEAAARSLADSLYHTITRVVPDDSPVAIDSIWNEETGEEIDLG